MPLPMPLDQVNMLARKTYILAYTTDVCENQGRVGFRIAILSLQGVHNVQNAEDTVDGDKFKNFVMNTLMPIFIYH